MSSTQHKRLGLSLGPLVGGKANLTPQAIAGFAGSGLVWCEVGAGHYDIFMSHIATRVAEIRAALETAGLQLWSLHGPQCPLAMDDPSERARAVEMLIHAASVAEELGAPRLVVHPGRDIKEKDIRREIAWCREGIASALESIPPTVTIAVETVPPSWLAFRSEDLLAIVEDFDPRRVGICFDSGHVNLAGDPVAFAGNFEGRIVTVHLHDSAAGRDHLTPGDGTIDWPMFLHALDRAGYDGVLMGEFGRGGRSIDEMKDVVDDYMSRMAAYLQTTSGLEGA